MDFSAPSFSLGFDWDDDDPPASSDRREQPRGYGAPDAPSFSLGIDDDDDVVEEPRIPARGRQNEQAREFAAPDPPSFSLCFDDEDGDGELAADQRRDQAQPQVASGAPSSTGTADDDDDDKEDDFVLAGCNRPVRAERDSDTLDPDPLPTPAETNRFKRLRKGSATAHPAQTPQVPHREAPDAPSSSLSISDDDFLVGGQHHERLKPQASPRIPSSLSIEDEDDDFFLAGDRQPEPTLPQVTQLKRLRKGPVPPHLAPSPPPPKVPGQPTMEASPVITEDAARGAVGSWEDEIEDWTTDEDRPVRDVPPSVGSCSTSSNSKFSLLNRGVLMTQSRTKASTSKFTQTPNTSASISLEESCTKKLLPKITVSPMRKIYLLDSDTDADDDYSQNKAKSMQQNSKPQMNSTVQKSGAMMSDNWATPALDEFCKEYFESRKDAGFSQPKEGNTHYKASQPKNSGHLQQQASSSGGEVDDGPPAMQYLYHPDPRVGDLFRNRLQHFVPIGAGSTIANEHNRAKSLRSCRRQSSSSAAATDDWVTPGRVSVPTDASKRRVHASGTHSGSGHWFTNDSGRKVYISKNGQELTGRDAYRQYQKESGRGFNRYKKKGSSGTRRGAAQVKTETAAKRGTSRAKRKR